MLPRYFNDYNNGGNMFTKILFPIVGSGMTKRATNMALTLAKTIAAEVVF
jgi:hypothetical protein